MFATSSKDIYIYCIDLLSRRAYSTFKLQRKLRQKQFPANEIEVVLKLLQVEKYLRDDLYAEARVRTWMSRGNSAIQMQRMLQKEKLSLPLSRIHEIFEENNKSEPDQIQRLLEIQLRKIRKMPTDPKEIFKLKQKITASLARKGQSFSLIKKALDQAFAAA